MPTPVHQQSSIKYTVSKFQAHWSGVADKKFDCKTSHLRISPRVAFQGNASGRPRANQIQSIKLPILVILILCNLFLNTLMLLEETVSPSRAFQRLITRCKQKYFLIFFWHPGFKVNSCEPVISCRTV